MFFSVLKVSTFIRISSSDEMFIIEGAGLDNVGSELQNGLTLKTI